MRTHNAMKYLILCGPHLQSLELKYNINIVLIFAFVNWNFLYATLKVPSGIEKVLKNYFACALNLLLCLFFF